MYFKNTWYLIIYALQRLMQPSHLKFHISKLLFSFSQYIMCRYTAFKVHICNILAHKYQSKRETYISVLTSKYVVQVQNPHLGSRKVRQSIPRILATAIYNKVCTFTLLNCFSLIPIPKAKARRFRYPDYLMQKLLYFDAPYTKLGNMY